MSKQRIYHYISEEETFARRLDERLGNCQEAILATAFFTFGAFQELKPALDKTLENGAKVTFLIGRFDFVTEPKAVQGLLKLAAKYPKQLRVYFDHDFAFHYKLAWLKTHNIRVVFIGSSNLTPKGLDSEGEVNLEIVNNVGVGKQTRQILDRRIHDALEADKHLDEYRRSYNRTKEYRRERRRWEKSGRRIFNKAKGRQPGPEPKGNQFELCWVSAIEDDEVLIRNIKKAHKFESRELYFPHQWVHFPSRSEIRRYKEGSVFAMRDDSSHSLGFAVCTKKIRVMNERNQEEPILFYRYIRGWRFRGKKDAYYRVLEKVGLSSPPDRIRRILSEKMKKFLSKNRGR